MYTFDELPINSNIYIYGDNNITREILDEAKLKYNVLGIVQTKLTNSKFKSNLLPVFEFSEQLLTKDVYFIVAAINAKYEIQDLLLENGVKKEKIIFVYNYQIKRGLHDNDNYQRILLYPAVNNEESFLNLTERFNWYYPVREDLPEIEMYCDVCVNTTLKENVKCNVNIVKGSNVDISVDANTLILVWDQNALLHTKVKQYYYNACCIDKNHPNGDEPFVLSKLYYSQLSFEEKLNWKEQSKLTFKKLEEVSQKYNEALVIGNGPSVKTLFSKEIENAFSLICNSIVKNKKLVAFIKPNVYWFADIHTHYSYHKFSMASREDVLDLVKKYKSFIAVQSFIVPLLVNHYPLLKMFIIGINNSCGMGYHVSGDLNENFTLPTENNLFCKMSTSATTNFLLPMACSLFDIVNVVGVDGKSNTEEKEVTEVFWNHFVEYDKLQYTITEAHPRAFHWLNIEDKNHRDEVEWQMVSRNNIEIERFIKYAQLLEKKIIPLCDSNIPILKEIYVKGV